ncbi:hypothetical protein Vretifemale_19598, partial [Volvox reticuliferus]
AAASVAACASRPYAPRRRALVYLPLVKDAVEALWCMRGGDDARLVALTGRFGAKLPGSGAEASPDWDPCQQMECLYQQISQQRAPPPLPPALEAVVANSQAAAAGAGAGSAAG